MNKVNMPLIRLKFCSDRLNIQRALKFWILAKDLHKYDKDVVRLTLLSIKTILQGFKI